MAQNYSRRILLVTMGTSPDLLTVTLSAMYGKSPALMPTELHILTTGSGQTYIDTERQYLKDFCAEYGVAPEITLPDENIHIISDDLGRVVEDMRTPLENTIAANFTTELIRDLCSDDDSVLYVSVIGGRKSLSLLIGTAMSLFGRDQDRIAHYLAKPEFQFRKPLSAFPKKEELEKDPELLSYGDIPFLRLRPVLPSNIFSGRHSFVEIVKASQEMITPTARLSLKKQKIRRQLKWCISCNDSLIMLPAKRMAFYVWLMVRTKLGRQTRLSKNILSEQEGFFLRRQYLCILKYFQTDGLVEDKSCEIIMGVNPWRLDAIERKLRTQTFAGFKEYYAAIKRELSAEEQSSLFDAGMKFAKNIAADRTHANVDIERKLSDVIPDITRRRITAFLINSKEFRLNPDKENDKETAVEYYLDVLKENITIPTEIEAELEPNMGSNDRFWKLI